jgi:hypothetical protein
MMDEDLSIRGNPPIFRLQDLDLNDLGGLVRWTPNGAPGVQVGRAGDHFFFFKRPFRLEKICVSKRR